MINQINKKSLTELSKIISCMEEPLQAKIPNEFYEFIEQNKDTSYDFKYSKGAEILPETKAYLSVLLSEYIGSEETKKKWKEFDYKYNSILEQEKSKNYSTELFKEEIPHLENLPLEHKESFIEKIINRIKSFFKSSK